jgi:DNA-binding IclR family transcriptional regulator
LCLAQAADPTVREMAQRVGITERAVHRILAELEEGGYVTRQRDGRRNTYRVHSARPLRHPIEAHRTIGDLIDAVVR